jgi:hypothetical protein
LRNCFLIQVDMLKRHRFVLTAVIEIHRQGR